MEREFLTVTKEEKQVNLAKSIRSRERELMGYDFEKESHLNSISQLENTLNGLVWSENITEYRNLARDEMIKRAISNGLSSDMIQKISNLNALDKHKAELEAVSIETAKSERQYDSLLVALPEGEEREAAFRKAKEEEDKRTGKVSDVEVPASEELKP